MVGGEASSYCTSPAFRPARLFCVPSPARSSDSTTAAQEKRNSARGALFLPHFYFSLLLADSRLGLHACSLPLPVVVVIVIVVSRHFELLVGFNVAPRLGPLRPRSIPPLTLIAKKGIQALELALANIGYLFYTSLFFLGSAYSLTTTAIRARSDHTDRPSSAASRELG